MRLERRNLIFLLVFGVALTACAFGAKGRDDGFLAVSTPPLSAAYLAPNPGSDQVELQLVVQAGEADNLATPGMAHYVEHLSWLNAVGRNT